MRPWPAAFAAEGARLALTATALANLDATLAECAARGAEATGVELDLADPRSVERAGSACVDALSGRVDVLVNNAGLLGARGRCWSSRWSSGARVIEVGVNGTMHLIQLDRAGHPRRRGDRQRHLAARRAGPAGAPTPCRVWR